MKKIILEKFSVFMAIALLLVQSQVYAHAPLTKELYKVSTVEASTFQYDEAGLEAALQDLNKLESYVNQHEGVTYKDVANYDASLVMNVSAVPAPMGGDSPLGIPSFLWGCVFGVLGILLVYLMTDNDMDETKKALWGCVAGTAVVAVLYFVVFATAATATSTVYY